MADMCRAAQGVQPPAAASARVPRSSAAEREAALLAAEGEDGLPVALPMPSSVATHLQLDPPEYPWRKGERSPLRA
jgi:hypothetical protein